jgi:hypothetical protein
MRDVVRRQCLLHSCGAAKGRLKSRAQRQRSIHRCTVESRPDSHQSPANSCCHRPIIPTGSLVAPRGRDFKVHVPRQLPSRIHGSSGLGRGAVQCSCCSCLAGVRTELEVGRWSYRTPSRVSSPHLFDCEAFTEQYSRCPCRLDQCRKGRVARPRWTSVRSCHSHCVAGPLTARSKDGWYDGWM